MLKSIKNRVNDLSVAKKIFVPEGQTDEIPYYQLLLEIKVNGEEMELAVKLDQKQAIILAAAEELEVDHTNFLEDEVKN